MSTEVGRAAEDVAAKYLEKLGHKILERNWRTRWCEIDIVSQKGSVLYFVEVKYRASSAWGNGLEYVTPKKLQQMRFAAEFWLVGARTNAKDCRLAAISLSDSPPKVDEWLDDIG
jgi:uncharacterized protein (TIGR00252 family)